MEEVLVGRARRVGGRQGSWWWQGDPREHYFIREHGHELFIIKLVKLILIAIIIVVIVGLTTPQWCVQVGDGIAHRPPVSAAPGGGEVEELVHPRRVLVLMMLIMA